MFEFNLKCAESKISAVIDALRGMRARKFAIASTSEVSVEGEDIFQVTYSAPEPIVTGLEIVEA